MQRAGTKWAFSIWPRTLAVLLLLVVVLAPACSSLCQAQVCQKPDATRQDSACHHQGQLTADHLSKVGATVATCGARELLFALPESAGKWQAGGSSAVSCASLYSLAGSAASGLLLGPSSESGGGQLASPHESGPVRLAACSLVVLRV